MVWWPIEKFVELINQGHNARGGGHKRSFWNLNTKKTNQDNNVLKSEVVGSNRKGQI